MQFDGSETKLQGSSAQTHGIQTIFRFSESQCVTRYEYYRKRLALLWTLSQICWWTRLCFAGAVLQVSTEILEIVRRILHKRYPSQIYKEMAVLKTRQI